MKGDGRGPSPFLTARWHHLLMLNWAVPPALLEPFVPAGTLLDSFDGVIYASMVGFLFLDTRVLGVPIPLHRNFEEVNLRFYVAREMAEGERRRGVVFVREIVPRRAIAQIARRFYDEPYIALPMRHHVAAGTVRYEWLYQGAWCSLSASIHGSAAPLREGSLEQFITEHYWGYTARRDGSTHEYRVQHPSWSVWPARDARFVCDVEALYGPAFAEALRGPPASAFVADGSTVSVMPGSRLG